MSFVLTDTEQRALKLAEERFLVVRQWVPKSNRQRLTALGDAVRKVQSALDDLEPCGVQTPELAALLAVAQELEGFRACQAAYRDRIAEAVEVLDTVERACRRLVRTGPDSEAVQHWIGCAADAWHAAGLTVSAGERSRFPKALQSFKGHRNIPAVSLSTLARALKVRGAGGSR